MGEMPISSGNPLNSMRWEKSGVQFIVRISDPQGLTCSRSHSSDEVEESKVQAVLPRQDLGLHKAFPPTQDRDS